MNSLQWLSIYWDGDPVGVGQEAASMSTGQEMRKGALGKETWVSWPFPEAQKSPPRFTRLSPTRPGSTNTQASERGRPGQMTAANSQRPCLCPDQICVCAATHTVYFSLL